MSFAIAAGSPISGAGSLGKTGTAASGEGPIACHTVTASPISGGAGLAEGVDGAGHVISGLVKLLTAAVVGGDHGVA